MTFVPCMALSPRMEFDASYETGSGLAIAMGFV